jgi:hypothetical protein
MLSSDSGAAFVSWSDGSGFSDEPQLLSIQAGASGSRTDSSSVETEAMCLVDLAIPNDSSALPSSNLITLSSGASGRLLNFGQFLISIFSSTGKVNSSSFPSVATHLSKLSKSCNRSCFSAGNGAETISMHRLRNLSNFSK